MLRTMARLIGRSEIYDEKKDYGFYPSDLERAVPRHSVEWPIDVNAQKIHLSCYFKETNYFNNSYIRRHDGLDIQVKAYTELFAPETSSVVMRLKYTPSGLDSVFLLGQRTGIIYILDHLESGSLPREITPPRYNFDDRDRLNMDSDLIVEEGKFVGRVGRWPLLLNAGVNIPKDVEAIHGRNYHHLHLETHNYSNGRKPKGEYLDEGFEFNPLLVLKDLKPEAVYKKITAPYPPALRASSV